MNIYMERAKELQKQFDYVPLRQLFKYAKIEAETLERHGNRKPIKTDYSYTFGNSAMIGVQLKQ